MPKSRLWKPVTLLEVERQAVDLGDFVDIEILRESRCDAAQEHAAESRARIHGQAAVAKSYPTGRGDGATEVRLQLCQDHVLRVLRGSDRLRVRRTDGPHP